MPAIEATTMKRHVLDVLVAVCAIAFTVFVVYLFLNGFFGNLAASNVVQTFEHPEQWAGFRRHSRRRAAGFLVGFVLLGLPGLVLFWSRFNRWLRRP
jgi:NADH:ubiquinone oxidoreductase subunit 2 (subunit N)